MNALRRRLTRALGLALFGSSLGGAFASCLLTSERDGGLSVTSNHCDNDAQCPGAVCDRERHVCVASAGARTEVVFYAVPPGGRSTDTATATTLDVRSVTASEGSVDISLRAPRTVLGVVEASVDPMGVGGAATPIEATVRFERRGAAPTEAAIELESNTAPMLMTGGVAFAFSRALVPGTYDIAVTPVDLTQYPPMGVSGFVVEAPDRANATQQLRVRYERLRELAGSVVDADTGLPVPGLFVRAVDPARESAIVSTVASTDAYGAFRVRLSPSADAMPFALQLTVAPDGAHREAADWRLTYEISHDALGAMSAQSMLAPVRVPRAMLFTRGDEGACAACVEVEASVEGQNADGASVGVGAASLEFHAEDVLGALPNGHRAWFDLRGQSERDGSVYARVLPGTYRVLVTPPDPTRFAVTSVELPIGAAGPYRGRVLSLRRPVAVTGSVTSATHGIGMEGATVEAVPLRNALDAVVARPNAAMRLARPSRAVTDRMGRFALRLDPGAYRLVARPPASSGFAAQVATETLVVPEAPASEAIAPEAPGSISNQNFVLEAPIAVSGVVTGADQAPLAEALVRAFARVRFDSTHVLDVELGSATADAHGRYSLLLPSQLVR